MLTLESAPEQLADDLARECLYRFLAAVLAGPYAESWSSARDPHLQQVACDAAVLLREQANCEPIPLGFGELPAAALDLSSLVEALQAPLDQARAAYDRVLGLVTPRECPPYETEYHSSAEPFFRAQQLADIAGFYQAFGLMPGSETPERPDYLPLELEFMAFLLVKQRLAAELRGSADEVAERVHVCEAAQRGFFQDHLVWWVPAFAAGLRRKAGDGLYALVAQALAAFLPLERRRFNLPAPRVPVQPNLIERPEEQSGCTGCTAGG
jgi:TorA maturation chaperone TorD